MKDSFDFKDGLSDLSLRQLLHVTNAALNRLTLRDLGEIFYDVGLQAEMRFVEKEERE